MYDYLIIALLLFVAIFFVAASVIMNSLLGLKPRRTEVKQEPFECGSPTFYQPNERKFQVKYATVAILFLMFDIETVLLYPWAVGARKIGGVALLEGTFYILVLVFALVYIWRKGLLTWH